MGNLIAYFCEIFGGEKLFLDFKVELFCRFCFQGSPANTSAGATGQQASSSYDIGLKMQIQKG